VALLWKTICNLGDPMSLCHPVSKEPYLIAYRALSKEPYIIAFNLLIEPPQKSPI